MSERLDEAYIWVRQNLFSEWDEDGAWEIKEDYGPIYFDKGPSNWLDYEGECDLDNKHIYISPQCQKKSDDEMYGLIVHETAHATSGSADHTAEKEEWPREMKKAAERARDVGKAKLADLIEGDRKSYEGVEDL